MKEYKIALQRGENMEKQNLSLQNQLSKYGILLQEEKQEKKERQGKYDQLNQSHFELIESF